MEGMGDGGADPAAVTLFFDASLTPLFSTGRKRQRASARPDAAAEQDVLLALRRLLLLFRFPLTASPSNNQVWLLQLKPYPYRHRCRPDPFPAPSNWTSNRRRVLPDGVVADQDEALAAPTHGREWLATAADGTFPSQTSHIVDAAAIELHF